MLKHFKTCMYVTWSCDLNYMRLWQRSASHAWNMFRYTRFPSTGFLQKECTCYSMQDMCTESLTTVVWCLKELLWGLPDISGFPSDFMESIEWASCSGQVSHEVKRPPGKTGFLDHSTLQTKCLELISRHVQTETMNKQFVDWMYPSEGFQIF